jgi:hypothetical protein
MDLRLVETGNGGDFLFENGDIQLVSEVYNQPYLAHFGGNKETPQFSNEDVEFWGNELLPQNEQFTSEFEKSLGQVALSSSGRIKLELIASEDLGYLSGFADSTSTLKITGVDKISLQDEIVKENNDNFSYIWTEEKDEII